MSRKTKASRRTQPFHASSSPHLGIWEAPHLEKRLSLVCGRCGASGQYHVGTITIDPKIAQSRDIDNLQESVGFTGYFRCRKCDAGGPWELTDQALAYVIIAATAAVNGTEDVPLIFGAAATFDKKTMRYATEGEEHLKRLIEREPERAFLWTRLGNFYSHVDLKDKAEDAYHRAIELDPTDIEAHSMLAQVLVDTGRSLDAVPNWHAVLKHARHAHSVKKELRRDIVRQAIENLLTAHAESHGQIDLLPTMDPEELARLGQDEPQVVEIRDFDLGTEEGIDELCGSFLGERRSRFPDLFKRKRKRMRDSTEDWEARPIRRETPAVPRNAPCPCGSGHKYKKCCGR